MINMPLIAKVLNSALILMVYGCSAAFIISLFIGGAIWIKQMRVRDE